MDRIISWVDASLAVLGDRFMRGWSQVERSYRRPLSQLSLRLKFAFYPLLAIVAIGWLGWDWSESRSLNSAEDAIFDEVVQWRPFEPKPSGRVIVVEIDECSIEYFRARGEGGWPWGRQRHADLLDALDRAGVALVGYDVLFTDASHDDLGGDQSLEAMAEGGAGRFVFASARLHPDYDAGSPLHVSQAPSAFALTPDPQSDPAVALLLPYGNAMSRFSAISNVARNEDGVIRDIPLQEPIGDWALPSLPMRLAMTDSEQPPSSFPTSVRPNWRDDTRLPHVSAANLLAENKAICRDAAADVPDLKGRVALVGYSASGLNDAKPTPVDAVMPGVEVMAEATEALIADNAIRAPPAWLKYVIAGLLAALTAFAFFRGEPAPDIDSIFVATNLALVSAAFIGLTFFGYFFDIFASVGFISLVFGLSRIYAAIQRGRAVGNADYLPDFDPSRDRWLAIARLRFVPDRQLDPKYGARRQREYNRRLRRFLYAGSDAVMLEGVVERKSFMHEALSDLMVLVWHSETEDAARKSAEADLSRLTGYLAELDERLPDDGSVRMAFVCTELDAGAALTERGLSWRLGELVGQALATTVEHPLARVEVASIHVDSEPGGHA